MARARRLAPLLGRNRDRQPHATLGTPALEDLAAARRGHPGQESMGSFATAVVRLVGPFHFSWLTAKFTRWLYSDRASAVAGKSVAWSDVIDSYAEHAIEPYRKAM